MIKKYYEEDELVQMVQSGHMSILGYVTHHSKEWDAEYSAFCRERSQDADSPSAAELFLQYKDDILTQGLLEGEA